MKARIAAAVVGACCMAPALAQTNITLYSIGSGTPYNLAGGLAAGSGLGFKGSENLGSGFRAVFALEAHIDPDARNDRNGYRLPAQDGLGISLMYSPQERVAGPAGLSNRFLGGGLKYQANGFSAGFGYGTEKDPSGNRSLRTSVAGGSYTMGKVKVLVGYMTMKSDSPALGFVLTPTVTAALGTEGAALAPAAINAISSNSRLDTRSYSLGLHYTLGTGYVTGAIARTRNDLFADSDVKLFSLGYDYNLSTRTDVYVFFAHSINDTNAQYGLGGTGYSGGLSGAGGQDANALQLGIRYKF